MGVAVYPEIEDKVAAHLIGLSQGQAEQAFVSAWIRAFTKPLK